MRLRSKHLALALSLLPAAAALAEGPSAAKGQAMPYSPVTDARLQNPEARNWLSWRGNYGSWGYSALDKINDRNVGKLQLAWSYSTGVTEGHQAPPIVNDGYMYVTTPQNQIIALNAKTGQELWRYKKEIPSELFQLHPTNRGVALYGDKVYVATTDCFLIALDAKTGKVLWQTQIENWKTGYYMTLAPLAAKGKIMIGVSGGEYGVRGFVAAVDANSGKMAWRRYTIPAPNEMGGDTWPNNGSYKTGGGSVWVTGTYDPKTNTAYWGTGNPGPWTPDLREGDNLFASSTLALDVDTGEIKGHHQYAQNDSWDWDEVTPPLLIEADINGKKTPLAVRAGRNGYMWVLERTKTGGLAYRNAWPYVGNNVFKGLDPKTGRPEYDMSKKPSMKQGAAFCPSLWGGKDWLPEAYSPKTGLIYTMANEHMCSELPKGEQTTYKAGDLFIGFPLEGVLTNVRLGPGAKDHIGEIQAWDPKTGKLAWSTKYADQIWSPTFVTAGNLVFAGGLPDRKFRALDAKTGKELWSYSAPSGVIGVPSSYEIDGEQYIAVQAGWGVDAQRLAGAIDHVKGTNTIVPQGGTLMVFKLPK
jgi:alcohol dehydrogenase (cytochrome c)